MHAIGKLFPVIAMLIVLLGTPQQALQRYYVNGAQLAKVSTVHVLVSDSVGDDDCVRDPNILKTEVELVLRRSGILAVAQGLLNHTLQI